MWVCAILSTAVANTTCWLVHAAGKPALAHCRLLHHLISSAQEAARKPRTLPSGPTGYKNLAGLYRFHGEMFCEAREKWSRGASHPCQYQSSSLGKVSKDQTQMVSSPKCCPLPVLQSILSLTLWWTQKIFTVNIHISQPFLHGLLIQSIFHFHADCRICAGVSVFLLQQIPPLCSTLLVSKALL